MNMALNPSQRSDFGAFKEKFTLLPPSSSDQLPLGGLSFAVKDIFDVEGHVTGFGNPDWAKTHSAAKSTAPVVLDVLNAGAKCLGITVMDEMAYSINGENEHYGTPVNPIAEDRVPGGSSSGSAVAVGAMLVDFSLGTDTGGSVRVPAAYCGIYGFRPSHGIVSTSGVIPMAQSFDTIGWFARTPMILNRVGKILLRLPEVSPMKLGRVIIAEDCFKLLDIPRNQLSDIVVRSIQEIYGNEQSQIEYMDIGSFVESHVPTLKHFMKNEPKIQDYSIPSLVALSTAMRLLQRWEFKKNHGEWVDSVKPQLGAEISPRVWDAVKANDQGVDLCHSLKTELRAALSSLLGEFGILVMPTVPGPPPKLKTEAKALDNFRSRAFSLLSIAGVSGLCQVSIPLGMQDGLPVAVSFLAKHGSDGFLLKFVEDIDRFLKLHCNI